MLAASSVFGAFAETHTLDINTRKAGAAVSPTMYGIFFEDINYAADGGLYGELVKNRSFEFPQALLGWQAFGNVEVKADGPFERCPHYVVLGFTGHKDCATGLQNEGYFGIGFVKDEPYRFTVWARALDGDATIDVSLADQSTQDETQERAKAQIKVSGSEWKKYEAVLTPGKTAQKGCLDLIEFANGDTCTTWGRKRAEMGHPAPFNLKYLAVGNEQWNTLYYERLRPFVKAIRAKYPKIRLIGTSGPDSEGEMFEKGWKAMKEMKADLVDEHFYRNEQWFLSHGLRYEGYDRKGPKVFAGEYACHGKGKKWNHFETSLYEAAFMTDIERNADIVEMATYAPLFAHVDGWQWRPDLIWFDNTRMFKSTSYYVQQMYACNKGTNVLPLTTNGKPVAGQEGQDGLFASAVVDRQKSEIVVKVVNTSDEAHDLTLNLNGLRGSHSATLTTLHSDDMDAENTLDRPDAVRPVESAASCQSRKGGTVLSDKLPAKTFRMYRIK